MWSTHLSGICGTDSVPSCGAVIDGEESSARSDSGAVFFAMIAGSNVADDRLRWSDMVLVVMFSVVKGSK